MTGQPAAALCQPSDEPIDTVIIIHHNGHTQSLQPLTNPLYTTLYVIPTPRLLSASNQIPSVSLLSHQQKIHTSYTHTYFVYLIPASLALFRSCLLARYLARERHITPGYTLRFNSKEPEILENEINNEKKKKREKKKHGTSRNGQSSEINTAGIKRNPRQRSLCDT